MKTLRGYGEGMHALEEDMLEFVTGGAGDNLGLPEAPEPFYQPASAASDTRMLTTKIPALTTRVPPAHVSDGLHAPEIEYAAELAWPVPRPGAC